jgi:GntR family transcriptional regulator/MocR family aminotransferase
MVKRAAELDRLPLALERDAAPPLPRQLADQVRAAIACGRLPVGSRLPSTRALALLLGVSRNTVATAYDDLLADDLIAGRVGSGSYVRRGIRCMRFADMDGNALLVRCADP